MLYGDDACLANFSAQPAHHLLCLIEVASTKQVQMIQNVIKIIESFANGIAGVKWVDFLVGSIEGRRKAAKKFGHGKICFTVAVIYRWIEQYWLSGRIESVIAAPEIAVQQ